MNLNVAERGSTSDGMTEHQNFMPIKQSTAKARRLQDKSITNGLEFCKYHIDIGKSRDDVSALIAGMYDFVIKLRSWEAESDAKAAGDETRTPVVP